MAQKWFAFPHACVAPTRWLLPLLTLTLVPGAIASSDPVPVGTAESLESQPLLSPRETSALESVAAQRPCAATAFLFVRVGGLEDHGTLQMDGLPTLQALQTLLGVTDRIPNAPKDVVLPRSPYSSAAFFVDIHWSLVRIDAKSLLLTTRAEIVDSNGKPLSPSHEIEPITVVLASGDSIRWVTDARPTEL